MTTTATLHTTTSNHPLPQHLILSPLSHPLIRNQKCRQRLFSGNTFNFSFLRFLNPKLSIVFLILFLFRFFSFCFFFTFWNPLIVVSNEVDSVFSVFS
jgi:hypothetical protein